MKLPPSELQHKFPLSTKKIVKKTLSGALAIIFVFCSIFIPLMIGIASDINDPMIGSYLPTVITGWGGILLAFILLYYFYQQCYFNSYYYDFNEDYVVIKKGCFAPKEINVPYERIQDVYIDQDIIDRLFGIYDVHLSTATAMSGLTAHIDGVEEPAAAGLKTKLLETIKKKNKRISPV